VSESRFVLQIFCTGQNEYEELGAGTGDQFYPLLKAIFTIVAMLVPP
jgi:hypothetical protein